VWIAPTDGARHLLDNSANAHPYSVVRQSYRAVLSIRPILKCKPTTKVLPDKSACLVEFAVRFFEVRGVLQPIHRRPKGLGT
jgi:hypothetical protein